MTRRARRGLRLQLRAASDWLLTSTNGAGRYVEVLLRALIGPLWDRTDVAWNTYQAQQSGERTLGIDRQIVPSSHFHQ